MIQNKIVVIPFKLPWEWSTDYTNQTAFILSKDNIVVCYLWGDSKSTKEYILAKKWPRFLKKHSKNLYLITPFYIIPFRRFKAVTRLNSTLNLMFLKFLIQLLSFTSGFKQKILWMFYPNFFFILEFLAKDYFLLYDCVDFFTVGSKSERKEIIKNERKLVQKADFVVANSIVLKKHLSKYRKSIYLVPQGFRFDQFDKFKIRKKKSKKPEKPLIGYIGAVNYRIDYSLLIKLAKRNPKWTFIISGPILEKKIITKIIFKQMKILFDLPNVSYELRTKKEIPDIISQFDIACIPYDTTQDFNKYCYPMKLFEYFYMGKPVVSSPIEELKRFPKFVKIGKNANEWEKNIKDLLSQPWPRKYIQEQRKLAKENSWENKINTIVKRVNYYEKN